MGSTRSPSTSTLDQHHSHYTHNSKRKSSKSSPEDFPESDTFSRKKKKKSKKDRHDVDQDEHHYSHQNGHDATTSSSTSQPQPTQKLPKIKISLKLPSNPSIISSTAPLSPPARKSSNSTKKKRRSSEHVNVDSDDNEETEAYHRSYQRLEHEYSDDEKEARLPSSHKKKKKHKHKHKHRHSRHEEQEVEEQDDYNFQDTQHEETRLHRGRSESHDAGNAKITLRLGKDASKTRRSSTSHRTHHNHQQEEAEYPEKNKQNRSSAKSKTRSRSQSMSQSISSTPVNIKEEEISFSSGGLHSHIGQKKPFASLVSRRSESQDIEMTDQTTEGMDEDDQDDPLAGELDDPEEDDEEDGEEDEEEADDEADEDADDQTNDGERSENDETSSHVFFGRKSAKGGQKSSKTLPGSSTQMTSKPKNPRSERSEATPEGSATTSTKTGRKGKAAKRAAIPKTSTPVAPKKKELSVVCHKLLDNFIRKDMYVLFSEPVDPTLVPDYSLVIKNPMDLSTMRAKVERNFYPNIDEFLKDFQLVCDNARIYNSKETLYWKQADKLWEWGSKAIERERKSVLDKDEELLRSVKDEETVDVGGMGDYNNASSTPSRAPLLSADSVADSPMAFADTGRTQTPQQYRKSKKIKHRRDGTIAFTYSTDGSIDPASHPDPWSLIPVVQDFGSAPLVCPLVESNTLYNGQYLDDYPYWRAPKTGFRSASYLDYGPYAILGKPPSDMTSSSGIQNIPAYTGMVYGDEKGEAYVRSLAMFLDGIVNDEELTNMSCSDTAGLMEVKEYFHKKVETLTRGASTIIDKVAAVVREDKSGQTSKIDTRVPLSLWEQNFDVAEETEASSMGLQQIHSLKSTTGGTGVKGQEMSTAMEEPNSEITTPAATDREDGDDTSLDIKLDTESEDIQQKDDSAKEDEDEDKDKDDVNSQTSEILEDTVHRKVIELVDIRQVIRDIQAWPKVLREKTDYETWKLLKVELDSLLPASQRSSATATAPPVDPIEIEIKWGQTWAGGGSEEDKRWVREYLEKNSSDMKRIVQLLAEKNVGESASTSSLATSPQDGHVKKLMGDMIKDIRKRLAEMSQYIPLSEVNPQKLPPPTVPVPATAPSSTPTSTSALVTTSSTLPTTVQGSNSTQSDTAIHVTQDSTTKSTPAAVPVRNSDSEPTIASSSSATTAPDTPGGSTSSLSSPGSSP
ncbi:pre-mRNA-splicing factor prp46 [Entomortierella beljakovae]|nr:pre-mRNA-splicing factor prp46 [Entomortierella beljakovae]